MTAVRDIWRSLQTGHSPPAMGEKVGLIAEDFGELARVLSNGDPVGEPRLGRVRPCGHRSHTPRTLA